MSVKLIALVQRRANMTQDAFARYWRCVHAPLAAAIPGMRGYRINVAQDQADHPGAPYHGTAEIWFDSRAEMAAGLASQQGRIAGDDTAAFADSVTFLVTEETVILPEARP